jgi:hypothetical protein
VETIKQRWVIPEDHKVHVELDIPRGVPAGEAEVIVVIESVRAAPTEEPDWMAYAGCLRNDRIFHGDAVEVQRALRDEWD